MAHVRFANRHGTAREEPEQAPGYVGSGAGEYSRKLAGGGKVNADGFEDHIPPQPERWRTVYQQITRVDRQLRKARAELAGGVSHARRALLESNVEIKTRFLAKLQAERARYQYP